MGSINCMNEVCRSTESSEWKKGWTLKSGGFATLCYNCGSAFENSVFCETFHSDESGWRECKMCMKRLHCGCIASRYLHEYVNVGGVACRSCVKRLEMHSVQPMQVNNMYESPAQTSLNSLSLLNNNYINNIKNNNNSQASVSQPRVPRPPAEGRGHSQLLPRYWPKITDQELQEISGEIALTVISLKSNVVPLFEKILTASDTGRIGRLVLPKACAEAHFPSINQSEGIPITIQDIKGKKVWTFQFRFWPNNNSRMYVLEGVTPWIQAMQLQAGDTVIFSRLDPSGQLVTGYRKATSADAQESRASYTPNGKSTVETSFSATVENVQSNGGKTSDHMSLSEKKKARNMKNERLLMHSEDAMQLRTWEEAQGMLRPSTDSEPAVVTVEGHEFEEFQEPPVFGTGTIFTSQPSGYELPTSLNNGSSSCDKK